MKNTLLVSATPGSVDKICRLYQMFDWPNVMGTDSVLLNIVS